MTREVLRSDLCIMIQEEVADPPQELALHDARIRLTAHYIAQLRTLAYRDCPKQTLSLLPSLQQPLQLAAAKRSTGGGRNARHFSTDQPTVKTRLVPSSGCNESCRESYPAREAATRLRPA